MSAGYHVAACSTAIFFTACAVKPYSVTVAVPSATLFPASADLLDYTKNSGLPVQLERTTRYCGTVKKAIATELDERNRRNSLTKRILLFIGSAAALATTIYSGLEDNPSKDVLVPLSAVTGSALLSALPSLTEDERASALRDKLTAVNSKETAMVENLNAMQKGLLDLGILQAQLEDTSLAKPQRDQLKQDLNAKYVEIDPIENRLRVSLAALANECT